MRSGRAVPVQSGGIASLATTVSDEVERPSEECDVVPVCLVEELCDDESTWIGLAELAESSVVGNAFSGREVGDRLGAR